MDSGVDGGDSGVQQPLSPDELGGGATSGEAHLTLPPSQVH